ncbi:MAG: citrate synthase [Sporichthyaceae bacterium]|nr:citrate synthase [Sporichthyaceae bacterium]
MDWMTTTEAAARLGVKPATLYAYVSRGVLHRRPAPDGRGSLFDPAEVDELARHGRPRRPRAIELVVESAVTALIDERPYYRGRAVTDLAATASFEEVAGLLWTGELAAPPGWATAPEAVAPEAAAPEAAAPEAVAAGRSAQSGLPEQTLLLERLQVIVAALAAADPMRLQFEPDSVVATGQNLITGMVQCLPAIGPAPDPGTPGIAVALWPKLSAHAPTPGELGVLQAALVLLADHELAASTLAARVAASVRADPYAVVAAGLGVVGGALHGGAALGAEAMLAEACDPREVPHVIGERLRRGERIPGFGHFVYKAGDPRATFLLDLLRRGRTDRERLAVVEAVLAEAARRRLPEPNIDFALAAFASTARMVKSAAEAIFAIARTAGWIAHALEEYQRGTPLRPRAVYTGPLPDHSPSRQSVR